MRPLAVLSAFSLALALMAPVASWAAPSTKFEPTVTLQDTKLVLNGAGTRTKVFFKVYDLGLYTTKRVLTADELLALPGPKRLFFTALREVPGTDLGRLFVKGLAANSPPDLVSKHTVSSNRLIEIFSGRSKLMPGDTFAMDFVPGKGTQFYIAGKPQGGPVGDDEYFNMVLKIWVGASPAEDSLKTALLGTPQ
jgi:hypothetical protein